MKISAPRLAMAVWLLVIWVALWSRVNLLVVLSGALVVALVYRVTRLPAPPQTHRVRPLELAITTGRFFADLVASSLVVARLALQGPQAVRAGILQIPYRVRSSVLLILLSNNITLRPGSVVMEIDGGKSLLYVHGIPIRDQTDAQRVRADVRDTERRLMRTFPLSGRPTGGEGR
ncbi:MULTISPECIES: Na+/H+ antiporter subunit E [Thermomonospora]|uniref:Cation antiporter n=1 Tax=Thermomonospora curvata (strain ATCC 19995 / DSM 43183 / JCM 3096 / KCTC 9072 / NBRC 15933 / NCIMB 10081 / Henssen B9) TaxID=471852 RepID=D1A650_THECD|nr:MULTISPECIES: Na+/H+ antiporter subunit E [Thermomonospora]ACZ00149.1 cation antiporter [Thermomonospora curvata DSM 43183]PKK11969.1 MAG: hypothetical protein BUE48_022715 [Thermomonospora sp. CIF 1]